MLRKLFPFMAVGLSGVVILPVSNQTLAQTPLTRAVIQDLRNLVQLQPYKLPRRKAQRADAMRPKDGLSTGRSSLADLRFNDGSMARVGEQAIFQFLPQTRNFTLKNGTVLLLIPPGQGRTNIKTPSAAAAIRGSALFVRYDKETDTTVIGALTNSGIEVFDKKNSASQVLKAGQMMVVMKGKFEGLYDFDLQTFYETSDLVRGLDLTQPNISNTQDTALNSVRAETSEALSKQPRVAGPGTIENPSFVQLTASQNSTDFVVQDNSPKGSVLEASEVQTGRNQRNSRTRTTLPIGVTPTPPPEIKPPIGATPTPPPELKPPIR
ncbi:MAG: FecR domain-containing protein, partial [Methylacidiphilales bacterium]|nr:FecR domain-containing protein [Candidatus Methylacidiphilales bacterium]